MKAIHSPHTGIVDWALVTEHYSKDFVAGGGKIFLNFNVTGFVEASSTDPKGPDYPVIIQGDKKVKFLIILFLKF